MFKADFKWKEPKEYKKVVWSKRASPSKWLVLLPIPFLLPLWFMRHEEPQMPFWVLLLAGAFLGGFLVYGVPWLYYVAPTEVKTFKKAMIRFDRQHPAPIEYKNMSEFSFYETQAAKVLKIHLKSGGEFISGLPKDFDTLPLIDYLKNKGLEFKENKAG